MSRKVIITQGKDQVLTDVIRESPVSMEQNRLRRWLSIIALIVLVIIIVAIWLIIRFSIDRPVDYADIREHFNSSVVCSCRV